MVFVVDGFAEVAGCSLVDVFVSSGGCACISSIEQANKFVQQGDFIEKHNAKFAIPPAQEGDAHRSIQEYNLDKTFCIQEERVVTNDFTISYKRMVIQLTKDQPAIIRPKNRVIVCQHLDGKITVRIRNCQLNFEEIGMRRTKKLSPVEYVNSEKIGPSLPLVGGLRETLNNHNLEIENRNFSCC